MPRIVYANGAYRRYAVTMLHAEDRGVQFADSIYEGVGVWRGRLVDYAPHFDRLERSASEINLQLPCTRAALEVIAGQCIRRNRVSEGLVYVQVTRGTAPRKHIFLKIEKPSLVVTATAMAPPYLRYPDGVDIQTQPDLRWHRCDIKSTALLPNILAKQAASEKGAYDAWFVDSQGAITEGGSTNAWMVADRDTLVTPAPSNALLSGVTRATVINLARQDGLKVVERAFTVEEAYGSSEAFLTSTSSFVMPVVRIDGRTIGDGRVGPAVERLRTLYRSYLDKLASR